MIYFLRILENIAWHKYAWQLHPYENMALGPFLNASNAVDGLKTNLSFHGFQCTISSLSQFEALWRVDLGAILGINHITLYYRTDNVQWGKYNEILYFEKYISGIFLFSGPKAKNSFCKDFLRYRYIWTHFHSWSYACASTGCLWAVFNEI